MEQIKKFFTVGRIYEKKDGMAQYVVTSVKDLQVIREHFEKYTLLTKKRGDFELWIKALDLYKNKEHLTEQGLQKIVAIRATLNRGLTDSLKAAFPTVVPVNRSDVDNITEIDPDWMAGFTSAEGSFMILIRNSQWRKGVIVELVFQLAQHSRDEQLIKNLVKYFESGYVSKYKNAFYPSGVKKFADIQSKISPFFNKYPIQGVKNLDYLDFCKAAELMKNKARARGPCKTQGLAHLTKEGLDLIRQIKANINKGRADS